MPFQSPTVSELFEIRRHNGGMSAVVYDLSDIRQAVEIACARSGNMYVDRFPNDPDKLMGFCRVKIDVTEAVGDGIEPPLSVEIEACGFQGIQADRVNYFGNDAGTHKFAIYLVEGE